MNRHAALRINQTLNEMSCGNMLLPRGEKAWQLMLNDKKNVAGRISFVLLKNVGDPVVVDDVTPDELETAVRESLEPSDG